MCFKRRSATLAVALALTTFAIPTGTAFGVAVQHPTHSGDNADDSPDDADETGRPVDEGDPGDNDANQRDSDEGDSSCTSVSSGAPTPAGPVTLCSGQTGGSNG